MASIASQTQPVTEAERYAKAARRAQVIAKTLRALMWVALLIGAVTFLLPLYIMLMMSLKTPTELATSSVWAWPKDLTWDNFHQVLTNPNAPFYSFFKNSFVIATASTLGVLLSSSLVAYPFARLKFRGRDRLFVLLLSTMMLPGVVMLIPNFLLFRELHWIDTLLPLTVPSFFGGGAFNIFLMRQFFMSIPREMDEAAVLDGANHAIIFWRIIIPNSTAALATVGIFCFIYNWKDFMGPLVFLNSPENQTLELGLRTYQTLNNERWELMMAASVLVTIPLIVIFFLGQKYFTRGIVMTGGK